VIAEERGAFRLDEVIQEISRKLVHRHPHIYADGTATSSEQVSENWEQLKMKEGRTSIFDRMPKALPALQRAERVQEKASKVGFDWKERRDVWKKVREEIEELEVEVESGASEQRIDEEFGDLLFALVNYARFIGISPEETLQRATTKFIGRFQHIESRLAGEGRTLLESNLEEMDRLWDEAKRRGGEGET
jgi:XTP/dITP diphosphohydrolase